MVGFVGSKPLEMGQTAVKAVKDTTKQQATLWAKAAAAQITGKPVGGQAAPQQKAPDAMEDMGKLLEQNQTQQTPYGNPSQNTPRVSREEEFAEQRQQDREKLAIARNEIQKLEEEMAEIKRKREQAWLEQNKEEEDEKKMEDLEEKKQNQQPVRAGSNPEGGKKKG